MLARVKDGNIVEYPYSMSRLRREFPSTSFPKRADDATLAMFGVVNVQRVNQPSFDTISHQLIEDRPAYIDGQWVQQWTVAPYEDAADRVALHRDAILAGCSEKEGEAWALYREQLHAITSQGGFPLNVTWPERPEDGE